MPLSKTATRKRLATPHPPPPSRHFLYFEHSGVKEGNALCLFEEWTDEWCEFVKCELSLAMGV